MILVDTLLKSAKAKVEILVKKYNTEASKEKSINEKKLQSKKVTKEKTELDQQTLEKLRVKMEKENEVNKWKDYHKAIVKELTSGFVGKDTDEADDKESNSSYCKLYLFLFI